MNYYGNGIWIEEWDNKWKKRWVKENGWYLSNESMNWGIEWWIKEYGCELGNTDGN